MTKLLECVEIDPRGPVRSSVIWLHGLGADGHDFAPIVPELGLPVSLGVRFVLPHADSIPVTINGGMRMPAWYDIAEVDLQRRHDEPGIRRSAGQVAALIARERQRGVPSERIVLAGFSQGGAVAVFEGLRHPERLAGIVALSTYLVGEPSLDAERTAVNQDVPILQVHGTADAVVVPARGAALGAALRRRGYAVESLDYPMQHEVCWEEIVAIAGFLRRVLA
ncbi:MAG: alpha/beta hydrolase [Planctomycetes bacterium]|jgi:phospholipase/carboxylesterase|nr:alpha/beta hydrolase [Planctomycetota bacterium]